MLNFDALNKCHLCHLFHLDIKDIVLRYKACLGVNDKQYTKGSVKVKTNFILEKYKGVGYLTENKPAMRFVNMKMKEILWEHHTQRKSSCVTFCASNILVNMKPKMIFGNGFHHHTQKSPANNLTCS